VKYLLIAIIPRVLFYLTGHIYTDAYITWRCAENLRGGVYGYNAEPISAVTSHLYLFMSAILTSIPLILIVNDVMFLVGLWLIVRVSKESKMLWAIASLFPVSLLCGGTGMESGLLFLFVGLLVDRYRKGSVGGLNFFLAWVRPDAVIFGLIASKNKKDIGWLFLGGLSVLVFNKIVFDDFIFQTIRAKSLMVADGFFENLWSIYVTSGNDVGYLAPIKTKLFRYIALVFPVGLMLWCWRGEKILFKMAFIPPLVFAVGGVIIFPWYYFVSGVLAYTLLLTTLKRKHLKYAWLVVFLTAGQLLLSINEGRLEEFHKEIGEDIAFLSER